MMPDLPLPKPKSPAPADPKTQGGGSGPVVSKSPDGQQVLKSAAPTPAANQGNKPAPSQPKPPTQPQKPQPNRPGPPPVVTTTAPTPKVAPSGTPGVPKVAVGPKLSSLPTPAVPPALPTPPTSTSLPSQPAAPKSPLPSTAPRPLGPMGGGAPLPSSMPPGGLPKPVLPPAASPPPPSSIPSAPPLRPAPPSPAGSVVPTTAPSMATTPAPVGPVTPMPATPKPGGSVPSQMLPTPPSIPPVGTGLPKPPSAPPPLGAPSAGKPPTMPAVMPPLPGAVPTQPPRLPQMPGSVPPGPSVAAPTTLAPPPPGVGLPGSGLPGAPSLPKPPAVVGGPVAGGPASPQPAVAKKSVVSSLTSSPFKLVPIILIVLLVVAVAGFFGYQFLTGGSSSSVETAGDQTPTGSGQPTGQQPPQQSATITYWGLWEPSEAFAEVIGDFETANPGIKVKYEKQTHKDYRERLQTAIAAGTGPDAFRFHAAWTPMLGDDLASMPTSVMSTTEYQQTFYPVAASLLQSKGQIVGIPLMYDGLGLYYNKDIFKTAGEQPPRTWAEVKTLASKLTVRSGGDVKRGGLAIGNAANVEHFSDILGLLMIQNGADLNEPTSKEAQEALTFYTNFYKDQVWSDALPSSTVAFARGEVAMMFAPSWRAHEVEAINPDLNYGVVPMPTLGDQHIGWATFWAEGVNSKGKNKDAAWKFLKYLSTKEVMQKLYSEQAQTRRFGELYSRTDLANTLSGDATLAPFLQDAPTAQAWYISSYTHDNGLNDQLIKYYADAVNALNQGKRMDEVIETLDKGTKQVIRQYASQ